MNDWRLRGQERYLQGVSLTKSEYKPYRDGWDHDHCEFCNAKFSMTIDQCQTEGWSTLDKYHWICSSCYEDFKEEFEWS